MRLAVGVVAALWLLAAAVRPVSAQAVSATLLGNVTDASGAVLPGAAVTVTETKTGISRQVTTGARGGYSLPYLPPGTYRVEIERSGFRKFVRDGVEVRVATVVRVDAALELGSLSQVVEVRAEPPLLQTDRAEVSRSFSDQAVRELPLANRSFQALVGLVPGVTPPAATFTPLEDPQGTHFYQSNGQWNSANNTQVDGVDNNDPGVGITIYIPPAEAVQEVSVATSNYHAEFGRAGGAVLNVITRGGANELHGSLFAFNRHSALAARNFFNTKPDPRPEFSRNQFGATLGGPVARDRTFFFGSYQGSRLTQSRTVTTTVPVAAWREGDFSGVPGLGLYDPATGSPDGTGRLPFPGNAIPPDRFHPVSRGLLPLIPLPNRPGFTNNLVVNVPFRNDGNNFDGRIDHRFGRQTSAFLRYSYSRYSVASEAALGSVIGEGTESRTRTHTAALNLTHGFSSRLLAEVRFGYNRYRTSVNGINIDRPLGRELGIRNPDPDPISEQGMARVEIAGMQGIGPPVFYPLVNTDNIFNLVNTWTWVAGRHGLKWGVDVRRVRLDRFQPQGLNLGPRGRFDFNAGTTALRGGPPLGPFATFGNAFAAFLLGATDQTSRTFQTVTPTNRQTNVFAFVHDTFQVHPRLTLDLGLRYELYTPVTPRKPGGAANYDPETNSLLVAGIGEVDMATGVKTDWDNLAPRLGFSYRLGEKSVVRGGYGLSYFTGRFGFTGGTLSTQFPVIYNVQQGVTNDFAVNGSFDTLPAVPFVTIPANGIITPAPNQGFFHIPWDNTYPYVHSFSLTGQRQLPYQIVLDVGYVGTRGRNLPYNRQLNAAAPGTGTAGLPLNQRFGRTASTMLRAHGVENRYDSLQVNATRRFHQGLGLTVAYTYGKAFDVGSDQPGFINNLDLQANHGPANFDRRHMLTLSHIYELPFGPGRRHLGGGLLGRIVGNWQLNGIFRAVSGAPITPVADATPCACPGNGNFADQVGPVKVLGGVGRGHPWFDVGAFAPPGPNRFGTARRNSVRGPGFVNYDLSVFRTFPIRRARLEFRAEFYNLTNTPRFGNPANNVNSGDFGQILAASGEREIQLALRLVF